MFLEIMKCGRRSRPWNYVTVQRIYFFLILYLTINSSQIDARKKLVRVKAILSEDGVVRTHRAPLYERGTNQNSYHLVNDDHSHPQLVELDHHHEDSHDTKAPSQTPKYAYIIKKPRDNFRNTNAYIIDGIQSTQNPPLYYANSRSGLPNSLYYPTPTTAKEEEAKKYAFAYAVRPKDGYSSVADDFSLSHKESRDGKVTMGEYKVLLPDGRLQVVRYTADGKSGFKADVTYEGEDHSHEHYHHPEQHSRPLATSRPKLQKQYTAVPILVSPSPSPSSPTFRSNPIFSNRPLKSHPSISPALVYNEARRDDNSQHQFVHSTPNPIRFASPSTRTRFSNSHSSLSRLNPSISTLRPAVSPTFTYSEAGTDAHHRLDHRFIQSTPNSITHVSSTPQSPIRISPTPYSFTLKKQGPSPNYNSLKRAIGPTINAPFKSSPPTPRSIYDKINSQSQTAHYAPVAHGQRAGPSTQTYIDADSPQHYTHSESPVSHDDHHEIVEVYQKPRISQNSFPSKASFIHSPDNFDHFAPPIFAHPSPSSLPVKKKDRKILYHKSSDAYINDQPFTVEFSPGSDDHHSNSDEHHTIEHHYVLEHVNDVPRSPQYIGSKVRNTPKSDFPPVKSSLATFTSNLGYTGEANSKRPLYYKSKPGIPVGRPVRPSIGGLVYLETPATGQRPSALGVKEHLAKIPHGNIPKPKTTTHPYEVGAKDYGNNVNYSPATDPEYKTIRKAFTPSQEIPPEFIPRNSRQYLFDENQETIVDYNNQQNNGNPATNTQDVVYANYE